jgi:hypothetical protein
LIVSSSCLFVLLSSSMCAKSLCGLALVVTTTMVLSIAVLVMVLVHCDECHIALRILIGVSSVFSFLFLLDLLCALWDQAPFVYSVVLKNKISLCVCFWFLTVEFGCAMAFRQQMMFFCDIFRVCLLILVLFLTRLLVIDDVYHVDQVTYYLPNSPVVSTVSIGVSSYPSSLVVAPVE